MWCCGTERAGSGPVKENPHVQKNSHILFQAYGLLNQKTSSVMNSERSIYSLFYAQSLIVISSNYYHMITYCFRLRDSYKLNQKSEELKILTNQSTLDFLFHYQCLVLPFCCYHISGKLSCIVPGLRTLKTKKIFNQI